MQKHFTTNQNMLHSMTPQFRELVSQFKVENQAEYCQFFVTKNTSSTGGSESSSDKSSSGASSSSSSKKSKHSKKSFEQGNETISEMFTKKMEKMYQQTEDENIQNIMKRAKQQTEVNTDWKNSIQNTMNQQQQYQITKEQNLDDIKPNQSQSNGNTKNKEHKKPKPESQDELKKRLELQQQLNLLSKNEKNKAMLSQKKRDERWGKQPINGKQLAEFSNCKNPAEIDQTIQKIQAQCELKTQLQQQKIEAKLKQKGEKNKLFDDMIQELINSGVDDSKQVSKKQKKVKGGSKGDEIKNNPLKSEEPQQDKKKSNGDTNVQKSKGKPKEQKNADKLNSNIGSDNNKLEKINNFYDDLLINDYKKNMKKQYKQKLLNNGDEYEQEKEPNFKGKPRKQNAAKRPFQSFEQYWTLSDTMTALNEGKIFKGLYIANEKSQNLGRVKCDNIEGNVFINSTRDQNRALHNSVVAFKIIKGDLTSRMKVQQVQEKDQVGKIKSGLSANEDDDDENSNNSENQVEEGEWETESEGEIVSNQNNSENKLAAKVVHIFENPYLNSRIIGYLQPLQDEKDAKRKEESISLKKHKKKKKFWFIPKYTKLPRMIPIEFTEQFNDYVEENDLDITQQYVVATLQDWRQDSFHPEVVVSECIGKRGDIEIECEALIEEFGVYNEDFTPDTEEYLSKYRDQLNEKGEFIIPDEERGQRWDLTNEIICTIDPTDARDLDDALSVKFVGNGVYEVGVHIADVSHFVQPDTPLDEDARLRTTSVYLVHKVIPMLPRLLCENLCSLNPNVERLAFSVFFHMTEQGELLRKLPIRIGKSIINSASKFSYDTVQQMIENKIKSVEELPEHNQPKRSNVDGNKMFESIMTLSKIGIARRAKRIEGGVFSIENVKKRFKLDDKLWPVDYVLEDRKDSNFVVEEFMLLANKLIGEALVDKNPSLAVLRQHCFPSVDKQQQLNQIAEQFNGHKVDFTNLKSINESIASIKADPKVTFEQKLFLKRQMFLVLEQALYFVADQHPANEWRHFALNFDIYTHFTSPIRRYPDLLVHRVMNAILTNNQDSISQSSLLEIMELCNTNKTKSKKVSDNCQKIFMCLYLKDHSVESQAMVVSFGVTSMTIFVPDHEIQTVIYFADYKDIRKCKVQKQQDGKGSLYLTYRTKEMASEHTIIFNAYSPITACLTSTDTFPIDYKVKITLPNPIDKKKTYVIE